MNWRSKRRAAINLETAVRATRRTKCVIGFKQRARAGRRYPATPVGRWYKFDIFYLRVFDRREILAENHAGKTGGRVRPVNAAVCTRWAFIISLSARFDSKTILLLLLEKTPFATDIVAG